MKVIFLLLCTLSLTTAKVFPRKGSNDVFDGVEGVLHEIPEYEDPEVSLFKLTARGIKPVYTMGDLITDPKDLIDKDDKPHYRADDIKKGLKAVIAQLQEAKNKLENGNNGIYLDIDKSILSLENLKHHLYLDLHSFDVSVREFPMPDVVTEESSDKNIEDIYSRARSAIKKYLSSDDSISNYFSFGIPLVKPSSFDDSTDLSFNSDIAFVPYSPPNVSDKKTSAGDHSDEQSESISSKDQKLPLDAEKVLTFDTTTVKSLDLDKGIFEYQFLKTEIPPLESTSGEKDVETHTDDGVTSSAEVAKVDQGDKTFFRKKWSLKLSSTI